MLQEEPCKKNSTLISYGGKITREELAQVPTLPASETHQPIAHHPVVKALVESMSFRHIGVVAEEYAVSRDGMRMFGVLDLEASLTNAFTSAFKELEPIRQFKATAKLACFLQGVRM
jgi:hypothetical protein